MIDTSQVPSRTDCSFDCLSNQRCVSYNYEGGDKAVHQCELNSENKETKSSDLTNRAGYSYYGTGRNVSQSCFFFHGLIFCLTVSKVMTIMGNSILKNRGKCSWSL